MYICVHILQQKTVEVETTENVRSESVFISIITKQLKMFLKVITYFFLHNFECNLAKKKPFFSFCKGIQRLKCEKGIKRTKSTVFNKALRLKMDT